MKRHPALQQLSREHHTALKLARLAQFAADSGSPPAIAEAAASLRAQFPGALEAHFRDEEQDILPALAAIGETALVERTLAEHRRLRDLGAALANPSVALLAEFAELLRAHVRFEERELFETVQARLSLAS